MQSLDNSPDMGLVGGAWMELERHILMLHLAEVDLPLSDCVLAFAWPW